jgi:hypothetical protein
MLIDTIRRRDHRKVSGAIPGILDALDKAICANASKLTHMSVTSGVLGLSLFHFARSRFRDNPRDWDQGYYYLQKAFDMLNGDYVSRHLYKEIAELGRFLIFCGEKGFYCGDLEGVLADIDGLLYKQMNEALGEGDFDPITGALAYGHYFLRRQSLRPETSTILAGLTEHLVALSFRDPNGLCWASKLKGDDSIYTGSTHGISGVVLYFMAAAELGVERDVRKVVSGAVDYIRNTQQTGKPNFFPTIVGEDFTGWLCPNNWCYGDPGTLYALLKAGRFLRDEEICRYSVGLLEAVAQRRPEAPYLVAGPGLLYGHAGLATLYQKLYKMTGNECFRYAVDEAIGRIVRLYDAGDEYIGYRGYWNQEFAHTNYTYYEGMIGIALTLMAYLDEGYCAYYDSFFFAV